MKTITFYSYKGGTGRSLALANAARYLARLEFKVVALDFDLEAPGLHYKLSTNADGKPLSIKAGIVDYLYQFVVEGQIPKTLKNFTSDVAVPGIDKPLIQLIAAGPVPSKEYWSKLSRINWHELFYSKGAKGVQVFLDLKDRIADDLKPDFLLIDSRTGITEMGGVATTLLADKVITLVLPTAENLEGARAVLRSFRRSRRESGCDDLEVMVALSRIPQMTETDGERDWTERIRMTLNEEADDLKDTLSISEVFVLHSEVALEIREALRVGSGISPDESILLRDYLRLFAKVVPRELIEPKFGKLIRQAKEKIWDDPEAALKEVEELAESFGHPDNYRELLRFYEVRNVRGTPVLKRAQRLWELTRDSNDDALWQVLLREFDVDQQRWRRQSGWAPNLDFVEAVWRDAGKRNPEFAMTIAQAYNLQDRESRGADVLLEVLEAFEPTGEVVSRCILLLDTADRTAESDRLIRELKPKLSNDPTFVEAWARHVLRDTSKDALSEILEPPARDMLGTIRPSIAAQLFFKAGLIQEAASFAEKALRDMREREGPPATEREMHALGEIFHELGRFEEFERLARGRISPRLVDELRERYEQHRRRGPSGFFPLK